MTKKFHVAIFCSYTAYAEKRAFYTAIFGPPSSEGSINDGSKGHLYDGSIWARETLWFALLKDQSLTGPVEKLAHVGLIFDTSAEFDAEVQGRSIDPGRINILSGGQRQAFASDRGGTEWEFLCLEIVK